MGAPTTNDSVLALRLSSELSESLELAAVITGRSKSDLARQILKEGLLRMSDERELDRFRSPMARQAKDLQGKLTKLH